MFNDGLFYLYKYIYLQIVSKKTIFKSSETIITRTERVECAANFSAEIHFSPTTNLKYKIHNFLKLFSVY